MVSEAVIIDAAAISVERIGLRERQRQARYSAILKAAFDLITERGYDALTMESLADWVGITRQTLYHHFSSKDEIILRAILKMVDDGINVIQETEVGAAPVSRLRAIMRLLLEQKFSPTRAQFSKAKLSLLPFKARPEYRAAFDRRADALDEIVIAAQRLGQVRTDVPSAIVVQMLLSILTDMNYDDLIAAGAVTSQQVVNSIADMFFQGLRPDINRDHQNEAL